MFPAGAPSPAQAFAAPAEVLPAGAPSPAQVLAAQAASPATGALASPATGALAAEAATFAVCALCHPCAAASGRRPPAATGGLLPAERGGKETEESFYYSSVPSQEGKSYKDKSRSLYGCVSTTLQFLFQEEFEGNEVEWTGKAGD